MAVFIAVIATGYISKAMLINYLNKFKDVDIVSTSDTRNRDGSYTITTYLAVDRGITVATFAKILIMLITKYNLKSLKIKCKNYEIEIMGFDLEQTIELLDNILKIDSDYEKNEMLD